MTVLAIVAWPLTVLLLGGALLAFALVAREERVGRVEGLLHELTNRVAAKELTLESAQRSQTRRLEAMEALNLEHELARLRAIVEGQVVRK